MIEAKGDETVKDGGRAFPVPLSVTPTNDVHTPYHEGMSLRDWFAGQAVSAVIEGLGRQGVADINAKLTARTAYVIADALLKARGEGQ